MKTALAFVLVAFLIMGAKANSDTEYADPYAGDTMAEDAYGTDYGMDSMEEEVPAVPVAPVAPARPAPTPAPVGTSDANAGLAAAVNAASSPAIQNLLKGSPEEVQQKLDAFSRVSKALANASQQQAAAAAAPAPSTTKKKR